MSNIPIIYYHSIADHKKSRPWSFLSCPIDVFTSQMTWLKKNGYYTCDWSELHAHMEGKNKLPKKSIHIQFDDGFLDNWSVVYPLMQKLQLKCTVLLTPDFVQKSSIKRPFVSKTTIDKEKDWWGYLSEGEIAEMSKSGLVDFQAHGYTHTWYPSSDTIIDIYDGSQLLPHLIWNENENEKPFWLLSKEKLPLNGTPIFEYEKSLSNNSRFIPHQQYISALTSSYDPNLSKTENLLAYKYLLEGKEYGRYETVDEYSTRIKKELLETRKYISSLTGKEVNFLVYPGGGKLRAIDSLAKKYGYLQTSKGTKLNSFGSKLDKVLRFSGFHHFAILSVPLNLLLLRLQILRGNGNPFITSVFSIIRKFR